MEATEVRIGNCFDRIKSINNDKLGATQWSTSDWYNLGECTDFLEYYEPIPLTEEWLVKLGYKYDEYYKTYCLKEHCVRLRDGEFIIQNDSNSNAECYALREVKFVHDLQNWAKLLEGEELVIK